MQDLDEFFSSLTPVGKKAEKDVNDTAEAARILAKYKDVSVWHPIARVVLVQRQACKCGAVHEFSQGEFLKEQHKRTNATSRLTPSDIPLDLPKLVEYHDSTVRICSTCAKDWK